MKNYRLEKLLLQSQPILTNRVAYNQCWESQIFFLLRKAQIRNEN